MEVSANKKNKVDISIPVEHSFRDIETHKTTREMNIKMAPLIIYRRENNDEEQQLKDTFAIY